MKTVYRFSRIILLMGLGLLLAACASNTKTSQLDQGKQQFAQQNYSASFRNIQAAAAKGNPDAEYALGYMYYYGKGTAQDIPTGISWIQKAANQGQPLAAKAMNLIRTSGSGSALAANQPTPTPGQANTPAQANTQPQAQTFASQKPMSPFTPQTQASATTASTATPATPAATSATTTAVQPAMAQGASAALLQAPKTDYTIQILGTYIKADADRFISQHNLASKTKVYRTEYRGKPWFVVVYGQYPSYQQATAAVKTLPQSIQRAKPWVKSIASVQASITKAQTQA